MEGEVKAEEIEAMESEKKKKYELHTWSFWLELNSNYNNNHDDGN